MSFQYTAQYPIRKPLTVMRHFAYLREKLIAEQIRLWEWQFTGNKIYHHLTPFVGEKLRALSFSCLDQAIEHYCKCIRDSTESIPPMAYFCRRSDLSTFSSGSNDHAASRRSISGRYPVSTSWNEIDHRRLWHWKMNFMMVTLNIDMDWYNLI